jgi:hypothetical protein
MTLKILSSTPRQDGTVDVLFELDGDTEQWIGVPDGIAQDAGLLEDYVLTTRAEQPTLPGVK